MTNPFDVRLSAQTTAKAAILSALSATGGALSTTQLTQCGALYGVDAPAVRVALGRLAKNADVITIERGVHKLGDKGLPILKAIRRWIDLPSHTRPWDGAWVLVHTSHLGRTNRSNLRLRERALAFCGFAPYLTGLWVRPDNLTLEPDALRERLVELGMEPAAPVIAGATLAADAPPDASTLWNREALEEGYRCANLAIAECLATQDSTPTEELARQATLIGSAIVGMFSFDPLLPEEFVDANLRDTLHGNMLTLDRVGKDALRELIGDPVEVDS